LFQHNKRADQEVFSGDDDTSRSPTVHEPSEEEMELNLEEVWNAKRKQRARYTFIGTTGISGNFSSNILRNILSRYKVFIRYPYGSVPRLSGVQGRGGIY
jgi:hypothetical protein